MAYQMTHMEIAYRLLDKLDWIEKANWPEFILGSVSPDSVHMDDEYKVEQKVKSHLFENCGPWGDTRDYEQWLRNIRSYWENNKDKYSDNKTKAYLAGVIVHCLTDYSNDLFVWRFLQKKYIPPMTLETFREEYYPELRDVDLWVFQNSKNTKKIIEMFIQAECIELDGLLKKENIEKQKRYMLEIQYNREQVDEARYYKYASPDFLLNFIEETINRIELQTKGWLC